MSDSRLSCKCVVHQQGMAGLFKSYYSFVCNNHEYVMFCTALLGEQMSSQLLLFFLSPLRLMTVLD